MIATAFFNLYLLHLSFAFADIVIVVDVSIPFLITR